MALRLPVAGQAHAQGGTPLAPELSRGFLGTARVLQFDVFDGPGWPAPTELRRYFLAPPGRRWTFDSGNDSWGLSMRGLDGTEDLSTGRGRIDLDLTMLGNPDHGVLLHYDRTGGARRVSYYSRGDLRRLREWVLTLHGDLMPIGLYIPFETAWIAVKEFMETDGALPKSIPWIAGDDIPGDAFPRSWAHGTVSE